MSKKGVPHRKWRKEEKLRIVQRHIEEHISIRSLAQVENVEHGLISAWIKRYLEEGADSLEPKNGNPYAALHRSKNLSEIERLRLIVAKQ